MESHTKCALIQRSCGYSWRRSLSVKDIGRAIKMIKVGLTGESHAEDKNLSEHGSSWVWNPDLVGCIMIELICHCLLM